MAGEQLVGGMITTAIGSRPEADSTSAVKAFRVNGYGELATRDPGLAGLAEEGAIFVATNPTISTGMAWVTAQTAYSATAPNFHIRNDEPAGGKSIRLKSLRLIMTVAAASATAIHYAAVLDPTIRGFTTDYTTAITPVNVNGGASNAVACRINAQNNTTTSALAAASSGARVVARGVLGGLNIVGDELQILFGGQAGGSIAPSAATAAGQPGVRYSNAPPIVIAPQQSLTLFFWLPASSDAPDPEFELVFAAK